MMSPIASCSVRKPSCPADRVDHFHALVARDEIGELVLEPQRIEAVAGDARDRHLGRHARERVGHSPARRVRRRDGSSRATTRCSVFASKRCASFSPWYSRYDSTVYSPPSNGCSSFWCPRLNRCSSSSSERYDTCPMPRAIDSPAPRPFRRGRSSRRRGSADRLRSRGSAASTARSAPPSPPRRTR